MSTKNIPNCNTTLHALIFTKELCIIIICDIQSQVGAERLSICDPKCVCIGYHDPTYIIYKYILANELYLFDIYALIFFSVFRATFQQGC